MDPVATTPVVERVNKNGKKKKGFGSVEVFFCTRKVYGATLRKKNRMYRNGTICL